MHSDLFRMFCAVQEGHVFGMSGCRFETKEKTRHKATLIAVYVEPAFRGHGVGQKLVETSLMDAFNVPHIKSVKLTVTSDNAPAIALYERMGFESWAEEPAAIRVDNMYYPKTYMELGLERWQRYAASL